MKSVLLEGQLLQIMGPPNVFPSLKPQPGMKHSTAEIAAIRIAVRMWVSVPGTPGIPASFLVLTVFFILLLLRVIRPQSQFSVAVAIAGPQIPEAEAVMIAGAAV